MNDYDVIVCGAGPAGSSFAMEATKLGLKVAIIEKYSLPRHKTCGGGMPMVINDFLFDLVPEAFVESKVAYMRHTYNFSDPYIAPINPKSTKDPIEIWMVQRSIFDNELCKKAVEFGAKLYDGLTVNSVEVENNKVKVKATSKSNEEFFTASYLIGADGANGTVAKLSKLRKKLTLAYAMEIEHPHKWESRVPELRPDIAHFEYGMVKNGYAWIFPKADHLNIGAGIFLTPKERGRNIKDVLIKAIYGYMSAFQIPYNESKIKFYAHPLSLWNGKKELQTKDNKILLCGEAASLVNPFFGDGILHAVKSGRIAAHCIAKNNVKNYTALINNEFGNFDVARLIAKIFFSFPHFCYKHGVKRIGTTRVASELLCGKISFSSIPPRILKRLFRFK